MSSEHIVLAITGASGSVYAAQLLSSLLAASRTVHVVVSSAARQVAVRELGIDYPDAAADNDAWNAWLAAVSISPVAKSWGLSLRATTVSDGQHHRGTVVSWGCGDYSAGIASGSFLTAGMVICPCSTGTLSAIATGASTNLIHRAADVHLKERRPLVLVPRETPLSTIQLKNMVRVSQAGATVLPAMPGFYHRPLAIADLVNFVVARVLDQLHIEHDLSHRWGT